MDPKLQALHQRKDALQADLMDVQTAIGSLSKTEPRRFGPCATCGQMYAHFESFHHARFECVEEDLENR